MKTRRTPLRRAPAPSLRLAALCALYLAGCGDPATAENKAVFDVTYAPNTKVIEEAAGKALLLDPANAGTLNYRFDRRAAGLMALRPGDIVVLSGIAYRKVIAVRQGGDAIELDTERTTLPAAITQGTLEWSQPVDFANPATLKSGSVSLGTETLGVREQAITGAISYAGEIDGYQVSVTLTPTSTRLDISCAVSKEVLGEKRFGLEATGFINNFRANGRAVVRGGTTIDFQTNQQQVEGELHIKAAAFNTGASQKLLDLPLGVDIPIQVGPVPLLLKLKVNINVTAELDVMDSSAQAEVNFRYRSNQGISVTSAVMSPVASLELGELRDFLGGSADALAAGMAVCVEAPRIELSMLGEFASVGITQNNCASTTFTFEPPCNEVRGTITGIALANLGFFGVTLASGQVELYKREMARSIGNCQ